MYKDNVNMDSVLKARPLSDGIQVIKNAVKTLSDLSGCYQMFDFQGRPLYIGKAISLRKRVVSYTNEANLNVRHKRMVSETVRVETILTRNEAEALLLEASLIKRLKPKYNILLRDDKMLPSIKININHSFPRIMKSRGDHNDKGLYFGPFSSTSAVNTAVATLQTIFKLRDCSDHVLESAKRPCMLYQLQRCSAPCVARITQEDYGKQVNLAKAFFAGSSYKIQQKLQQKMTEASSQQRYELAANYRDRLSAFGMLKAEQGVYDSRLLEADVLCLYKQGNAYTITQIIWRAGSFCGLRSLFPKQIADESDADIMTALMGQLYSNHKPPRRIVVSILPDDSKHIAELMSQRCNYKVRIILPKGKRLHDLMRQSKINAIDALAKKVINLDSWKKDWLSLQELLNISKPINCIEVYDNSHLQGRFAVSVKVSANNEGWLHDQYRVFHAPFQPRAGGDDIGMMKSMMTRRIKSLVKEQKSLTSTLTWPDLMIIDGGQTHLKVVNQVLEDAGINTITLLAIAKGAGRRDGYEKIYRQNEKAIMLDKKNESVFFFLLRLRDEAHRFAIGRHRIKRHKAIRRSPLDEIQGIGKKRKTSLLRIYGSAKSIANAPLSDLERINGINKELAKRLHDNLKSI